jgi:hypothetical protein
MPIAQYQFLHRPTPGLSSTWTQFHFLPAPPARTNETATRTNSPSRGYLPANLLMRSPLSTRRCIRPTATTGPLVTDYRPRRAPRGWDIRPCRSCPGLGVQERTSGKPCPRHLQDGTAGSRRSAQRSAPDSSSGAPRRVWQGPGLRRRTGTGCARGPTRAHRRHPRPRPLPATTPSKEAGLLPLRGTSTGEAGGSLAADAARRVQ